MPTRPGFNSPRRNNLLLLLLDLSTDDEGTAMMFGRVLSFWTVWEQGRHAGGDMVLTSYACSWLSPHVDGALVHASENELSRAKRVQSRDRLTSREVGM